MNSNRKWLIFGIIISMLTWGVSWPSAKVLSRFGDPLEIAFIRFFFTFFGVLVILLAIKTPLTVQRNGWSSLGMGSLLMALYSLCFFTGIKYGLPGAGGVLVTTMTPIVTFLLASLIVRRTWLRNEKIGLTLGLIAGIFLLQLWSNYADIFKSGNLYFLASTVIWAVLSRFTATSFKFGSPLAFSLWMYLLCIFWLSLLVDFQSIKNILSGGNSLFWFNMIFNAVVNTGVATTIYFYTTSKLGPEKASSFIYIVPFAASISSFLFLQEIIHWNTIVGGVLGLMAVWIINKKTLGSDSS